MSAILAVYASHNLHCFLPLICFLSEKRHTPKLLLMKTAIQGITNKCYIYIYIYSIFSIMNSVLISLKWSSNSKFPISSHFILPISFHYFPFVSMSWWWLSHLSPLSLQFPIENDLNSPIIVDKVPFSRHLNCFECTKTPNYHPILQVSASWSHCSSHVSLFFPNFSLFFSFFFWGQATWEESLQRQRAKSAELQKLHLEELQCLGFLGKFHGEVPWEDMLTGEI